MSKITDVIKQVAAKITANKTSAAATAPVTKPSTPQTQKTTVVQSSNNNKITYTYQSASIHEEVKEEHKPNQAKADDAMDAFNQSLHDAGLKTTSINENKGEADFGDYGAALSDELKNWIINENSNEAGDAELQQMVAGLYKKYGKSVFQNKDFMNLCKQMGLDVSRTSVKTTYIVDNKADGSSHENYSEKNIGQ